LAISGSRRKRQGVSREAFPGEGGDPVAVSKSHAECTSSHGEERLFSPKDILWGEEKKKRLLSLNKKGEEGALYNQESIT